MSGTNLNHVAVVWNQQLLTNRLRLTTFYSTILMPLTSEILVLLPSCIYMYLLRKFEGPRLENVRSSDYMLSLFCYHRPSYLIIAFIQ